jgi:DNA-binding LytR/AlgR family response regulator
MFVKIHRSLVVSIFYIDNIARDHLIVGGETVGIGRQYYQTFIRKLNIHRMKLEKMKREYQEQE